MVIIFRIGEYFEVYYGLKWIKLNIKAIFGTSCQTKMNK